MYNHHACLLQCFGTLLLVYIDLQGRCVTAVTAHAASVYSLVGMYVNHEFTIAMITVIFALWYDSWQ